jgi:hypothetical protein
MVMRQHSPSCLDGPRSPVWRLSVQPRTPAADRGELLENMPVLELAERFSSARPEPSPRWELIQRIRAELAADTYLTEEKWERALVCLLASV